LIKIFRIHKKVILFRDSVAEKEKESKKETW